MKKPAFTVCLLLLFLLVVEGLDQENSSNNLRELGGEKEPEAKRNRSCLGDIGGEEYLKCSDKNQKCSAESFNCINKDKAEEEMEARANEAEIKQEFCLVVEDSLDAYYHQIFMMLRNLEKKGKGSLSYKYEVDFLCKNEDPESPGVRELASYTRFDYIEKCNEADEASCMVALAQAIKEKRAVMRKVNSSTSSDAGKIEYMRASVKDQQKYFDDGYYITDCRFDFLGADGDPTPYWDKPLPFDPDQLKKVCGDEGYGYYVD